MLLHHHLEHWARVRPELCYLETRERTLSYGDAQREVVRIAAALAASGLRPGDRIGLLLPNEARVPLLWFAASLCGVVPVPLNHRLLGADWAFILADAGVRLCFVHESFADELEPHRAKLPELREVVRCGATRAADEAWDAWLGRGSEAPDRVAKPGDEAFQLYTSGTTGHPKGVLLTQAALFSAVYHWCLLYPLAPGERQLLLLPMFHSGGLLNAFHAAACGATVRLLERYDPDELVRIMDEERIVRAPLVPTMIVDCLAVAGVSERNFEALRWITYGGAPMPPATLRRALEVFSCGFQQAYGMTEVPCMTYLYPEDHRRALAEREDWLATVGRAAPGVELRIVDAAGKTLPPGKEGEICARGPQMFSGYWNAPDATAAALRDGWMHTGDVGRLDEDGFLTIVDRLKDLIVSGAENVAPREVEQVILTHPDVQDVAVIGVPHERWGETVKAVVVLKPGATLAADALIAFTSTRLAGYKRPTQVEFTSELPRNASGKVLKRALRA